MISFFHNIKIFSSFWILLCCYFIIPIFIDSISPPEWFYHIDSKIPFLWWMVLPYYGYYIIIMLPPLIWKDEWKIKNITFTLNIITIICYLFFIIWPVNTYYVLNNLPNNPLQILHNFITYEYLSQNAFPSMHVAVSSFLCLAYYYDFNKYTFLALLIGFFIFLATFLIKQHYFFDSIGGLLIGIIGYYYYINKIKLYNKSSF